MVKTVKKLPKNPRKGTVYRIKTKRGYRCFKATGKEGFGKFKLVKCPKK